MLLLLYSVFIYPIISHHNIKHNIKYNNIKHNLLPSCKNCKYYIPHPSSSFASDLSTCSKFGTKNIVTDEIKYDYADFCRKDELKCGETGKYFEIEKKLVFKIVKHELLHNLPKILIIISYVFLVFYTFTLYFINNSHKIN